MEEDALLMHSEIISLKCMTRYFTRLCFGTDGKDLIPVLQNPTEWSIFCIELKEIAHMESFQDFQIRYFFELEIQHQIL